MNDIEKAFFSKYNINTQICYNANGEKVNPTIRIIMKRYDCIFAYNTSICKKDNSHTIQNTSGQCVICRTILLTIALQENKSGYVYIAASKFGKRIKIGTSSKNEGRDKSLNENKGYANLADWKILAIIKVDKMRKREREIQNYFKYYQEKNLQYFKGTELKLARECFRCNYEKVLDYIRIYSKQNKFILKVFERDVTKYNFPNLVEPHIYINHKIHKILYSIKKNCR